MWEQDKHPLVPRLDHPSNAKPAKKGVRAIRLENEVQISQTRLDEIRQVRLDQHIDRDSFTRLSNEWNLKLLHDSTSGTVRTKQVFRADHIMLLENIIVQCRNNAAVLILREFHKRSVETGIKAMMRCILCESGFKQGLRQIDGQTRASKLIVTLARVSIFPRSRY